MKKTVTGIAIAILVVVGIGVYCIVDLMQYGKRPLDPGGSKRVIVVKQGQDVGMLSRLLEKEGVIHHAPKFRLYARLKRYDKQLKVGEYLLSPGMAPEEILQAILNGKVRLYRLTIPEGYTIRQIAAAGAKAGLGAASGFLRTATDAGLLARKGIDAESFEGYLFPDTYYFPKHVSTEKIITTMFRRFGSIFSAEWELLGEDLGLSVHQVVTLASIIERETGAAIERPIISSVFHNRLKKRMRLESDPTVIYGIEDFTGNITRKHLRTPTPYNTYTRRGLPTGPIANPGKAALAAALHPADTRFLYFVSRGDGTHQFSENIRDHNRAVRKYQLRR